MQDAHRHFLQQFIYCGIMKGKEVRESHKKAVESVGGVYSEGNLVLFVKTVNDSIRTFHLEIKKAVDEVTRAQYYVLVNKAETAVTRCSSDFTANQLELFKKLIETIVASDDGFLSSTDALNLTDQLDGIKMKKTDAAKTLESFLDKKWINEFDGNYYLSPRSTAELEVYILQQYDTAVKCHLCQRLCLHGQNCPECDVRLHVYCASRCFRAATDAVCPNASCHVQWPHDVLSLDNQDGHSPQQSQRSGVRSSQRKTRLSNSRQ